MFGSKARKITELEWLLKDARGVLEQKYNLIKLRDEEIYKLRGDYTKRVEESSRFQEELVGLRAERDQLVKALENIRTERLETEAQRFREVLPEIKAPSDLPLES